MCRYRAPDNGQVRRHNVLVLRRKKPGSPEEPPSGIEAPDKVDFVAIPADESSIDLHIAQNVEWDGSDRVLNLLQQKIHNYVSFALDGHMARVYPEHAERPWRIVLDCQSEPDARTAEVLRRLADPVAKYGGTLVVQPVSR